MRLGISLIGCAISAPARCFDRDAITLHKRRHQLGRDHLGFPVRAVDDRVRGRAVHPTLPTARGTIVTFSAMCESYLAM